MKKLIAALCLTLCLSTAAWGGASYVVEDVLKEYFEFQRVVWDDTGLIVTLKVTKSYDMPEYIYTTYYDSDGAEIGYDRSAQIGGSRVPGTVKKIRFWAPHADTVKIYFYTK